MSTLQPRQIAKLTGLILALGLGGCASIPPEGEHRQPKARVVCDNYLIMEMCVEDVVGDGTTDIVYFSDTLEIFMYQSGRREAVAKVMPFHRCAVPLGAEMQATTNRILDRANLTLREEVEISKDLLANYIAAKPEIDACNARFEQQGADEEEPEEEFFTGDSEF